MRLNDLLKEGDVAEAKGDLDRVVTGLSYDSRKIGRGELFFAIPGGRVDGHDFAPRAVEQGASAVVLERPVALPQGATWVRVESVRRALGRWSAAFFSHPSRRLVLLGVTGTNGKTTLTYLLESIFTAAGMSSGVIGTVNYRYPGRLLPAPHTTPEAVELQALLAEMVAAKVQAAAMEVSSHALEMERVRGIAFDGALFTNLTRDHLDFHRDMEHYFFTKSRLFTDYLLESPKRKKFAVIHGGDPRGQELLERVRKLGLEVLSYGQRREWDIHPLEVKGDLEGLRGTIRVKDQRLDLSSRLIGAANLENILGAVGVAYALRLPLSAVAQGIAGLESVPGRLERVHNRLGITVLVDYAHTPDALERVLLSLRGIMLGSGFRAPGSELNPKPETRDARLICIFGCGGDRDRGKRPLMGEIAARVSDLVVLTSDNPRSEDPLEIIAEIEEGVRKTGLKKFSIADFGFPISNLKLEKGYYVEPDRRAAIRLALKLARPGDLVLIAGKGHEDYQILGPKKIHFDDREVAREELREKEEATGNRQGID